MASFKDKALGFQNDFLNEQHSAFYKASREVNLVSDKFLKWRRIERVEFRISKRVSFTVRLNDGRHMFMARPDIKTGKTYVAGQLQGSYRRGWAFAETIFPSTSKNS